MGLGSVSDGLAAVPPMGWNSWNRFQSRINERLLKETAEAMVSSGMARVGYEYVVIDDCWQTRRRKDGNLRIRRDIFPGGMRALADYVHSLGLKLGIYTCAGRWTCQRYAGSYKKAERDAELFAEWNIDFVKVDWCFSQRPFVLEDLDAPAAYAQWRDAVVRTGRPMVLSICEWGKTKPWEWATTVGHMWRTTGDIRDNWKSAMKILDANAVLWPHAGPGHWNDPDMLEVGNGGMTEEEYRSHFSLWAIMAAPLMAGNDLRTMSDPVRRILTAPEVIAVDQDTLGVQGRRIVRSGDREVWCKPLSDTGTWAVLLFNRGDRAQEIAVSWSDMGLDDIEFFVRDLWLQEDLGNFYEGYAAFIPRHGVELIRVRQKI